MRENKIYTQIEEYPKEIKLPFTASCFEDEIKEAEVNNKSYADFLHNLLEKEYDL